jgi:hypothetical protein
MMTKVKATGKSYRNVVVQASHLLFLRNKDDGLGLFVIQNDSRTRSAGLAVVSRLVPWGVFVVCDMLETLPDRKAVGGELLF